MAGRDIQTQQHDSEILARRAAQVQGGAARAAVLGINDGLVSTVCLVLGVSAATDGVQHPVLIAGFAGLIAGAFSMAAGEWISVKSQVELFEGILSDLKKLVKNDLPLLRENLEQKLASNGMSAKAAQTAAHDMATHQKGFAALYATQVLGVNPDELGSPWIAAGSSFALFTLGSVIALAPWFFMGGTMASALSIILTGAASLGVGAYIARSSGKSLWYGAVRQFLIVVVASAITYGVGLLFGVALS
ncbi:MAG: VIT1/CCC1 transporter family protein [Candidatus Saccharimonadales bacterium]